MVLKNQFIAGVGRHTLPEHPVTSSKSWVEVQDIMIKDVATISADEEVASAAELMSERNISCVLVVEDCGYMVGMLTERDLLQKVAAKKNKSTKIKELMTSPVVSVSPNLSILEASKLMARKAIRRLPIIKNKKLVGIVTQTDLTRALTSYGLWKDVAGVMTANVAKIQQKESIEAAAKIMSSLNISCILALNGSKVSGILTERDVLKKVLALQKSPAEVKVEEIMSSPVESIHPTYSVFSASRLMERKNFRRLVVMSNKQLRGVVTQTDIFRAVKTKLQEGEEKHLRLLKDSDYCIYTLDLEGNLTYANPAFMKLLGVPSQKLLNKPFLHKQFWLNPKEREPFLKKLQKGPIEGTELVLKNSKGDKLYTILSSNLTRDTRGKINGMQGILFNVTQDKEFIELVKAKDALEESEEKFRTLFEGAANPITILDREGKILMVNVAGARNMGFSPKACVGKSIFKLIPNLDPSYRKLYKKVIDSGMGKNTESLVELQSGPRWFWSIHQPVSDTRKGRYGVQIISYDITERKKAEEELKKRAKEFEDLNLKLKGKNLDLEKFKRLTVGRELRMAEIQQENKGLKKRLKGKK